jgi:transposase
MRGKTYAPEFKLKLVQQVINGEKRPAQLCWEHNISEAILLKWRHTFAEKGEAAFKPISNELETLSRKRQLEKRVAELERMIGQLAFENSILKTLLAYKTAPGGLFALLAHKTAPGGLFALLAHKTAPGGLFALSETYQKTGGSK